MKVFSKVTTISTKKKVDIIDITDMLEEFVANLEIKNGICLVHVPHATAALILNENEEGLVEDIKRKILEEFPEKAGWLHDRIDDNAYAHLASSFLGTTKIFPLINGRLIRGTWQNLLLVELDGPRSSRKIVFEALGE